MCGVCTCPHVLEGVRTSVQASMEARDWWRDVLFNRLSPLLSWDRVSRSNLSLQLKCLARELPLASVYLYSNTGAIGVHPTAKFLHGYWCMLEIRTQELVHACPARSLLTESLRPGPTMENFYVKVLLHLSKTTRKQPRLGLWRHVQQLLDWSVLNSNYRLCGSLTAVHEAHMPFWRNFLDQYENKFFLKETHLVPWVSWELLVK